MRSGHIRRYQKLYSSRNRRSSWHGSKSCIRNTRIIWYHKLVLMQKSVEKPLHSNQGKRPAMAMTASGYSKKTRLFYIRDSCHRYELLVDTCTEIIVFPPTMKNNLIQSERYKNSHIQWKITLNFGIRLIFSCIFIQADVKALILEADFLKKLHLSVNMAPKTLIDNEPQLNIERTPSRCFHSSTGRQDLPRNPSISRDYTLIQT